MGFKFSQSVAAREFAEAPCGTYLPNITVGIGRSRYPLATLRIFWRFRRIRNTTLGISHRRDGDGGELIPRGGGSTLEDHQLRDITQQ